MPNLKNSYSQVPVSRSVEQIERKLVGIGAKQFARRYDDDGELTGIVFTLPIDGQMLNFRLPSRVERVRSRMYAEVRKPTPATDKRIKDQGARTAWKLLYDQVDILVANVMLDQQDVVEAFFPYLYSGREDATLYEIHRERGFKALLPETT